MLNVPVITPSKPTVKPCSDPGGKPSWLVTASASGEANCWIDDMFRFAVLVVPGIVIVLNVPAGRLESSFPLESK